MSILVEESVKLANGLSIPVMGLGVFKVDPVVTEEVVATGITAGIRMIDTATAYENEEGVARGIARAGVPREDLFISTKLWNADHAYEKAIAAFERSLNWLKTDYIDLYLIHWPVPSAGKYVEAYQALEELYRRGKVKAIGVSNFNVEHLEEVLKVCTIAPMVNQIEIHPYLTQVEVVDYCQKKDILVEAWSPLAKAEALRDPVLTTIAERHGVSAAQVILRWHYQRGIVTIPKSVHKERIISNTQIFGFVLSDAEMAEIFALNRDLRTGPDPSTFDRM